MGHYEEVERENLYDFEGSMCDTSNFLRDGQDG